jgi:shikimate dehydrogenase
MKYYGLIGYPLTHSFSKKYFSEKFIQESILESEYELYEMPTLEPLPSLLKKNGLIGLNVTIPYKKEVLPFLDALDDESAERIGAVNTIKIYSDGSTKGFNTDYYGFYQSLVSWIERHGDNCADLKALVLGNGGAAKAVMVALEDLKIEYLLVSRQESDQTITYDSLTPEIIQTHRLIINTTPLGTYPNVEVSPNIPYQFIGKSHYLYDLVYNPAETLFLKNGRSQGAATQNGLKMLELQAEKAWDIWNNEDNLWSN